MELAVLDMIGNMTFQETILVVNKDNFYKRKTALYALQLRDTDEDCDNSDVSTWRIYGNGVLIDNEEESNYIYTINYNDYSLCVKDLYGQIVKEIKNPKRTKYIAKTVINGSVVERPWVEFAKEASEYFKDTGNDINTKYLEESKECAEFLEAARAVHAVIKNRDQLVYGNKYLETYKRLLPKYKHLIKDTK